MPALPLTKAAATALLAAALLAGCSRQQPSATDAVTASPDTAATSAAEAATPAVSVASALENAEGLQTVAQALKQTGLSRLFDGEGSYTLLAPDDDAFVQLGDQRRQLMGGEEQATLAALLREHILPGQVTPKEIAEEIDASATGSFQLRSLEGGNLTFTRSDAEIVVTAPDGQEARIDGDAIAAGNSVAIPLDAVLMKM